MKNIGKSLLVVIILVITSITIVGLSACSKNTFPQTESNTHIKNINSSTENNSNHNTIVTDSAPSTDKSDTDQNNKEKDTTPIELPPEPNNIVNADINGDGQNEIIELFFKKYISRAQDGEEMEYKYPYIRTVVNGDIYEKSLGNIITYETKIHVFNSGINRKQAIAVAFDVGGTGRGLELLYVLMFDNGLKFMPLPNSYGDFAGNENGSYGYKARVAYVNDYKARVICDETSFTGNIPLDKDIYKLYSKNNDSITPKIYDDNGKLIDEVEYMDLWVDGICDVKVVDSNGRQCVEFAQYVWGFSHGNGIGFLITTLTWEDGKYKVVSQKCIPTKIGW